MTEEMEELAIEKASDFIEKYEEDLKDRYLDIDVSIT